MDGDVGDHEVGRDQHPEHVFADVAGGGDLAGRPAGDPELLQNRSDQLALDGIEIDGPALLVGLDPERADDEGAHVRRSPGVEGEHRVAERLIVDPFVYQKLDWETIPGGPAGDGCTQGSRR